jgi:hypothetical protein
MIAQVILKPSLGLITTDDGDITRISLRAALSSKHVNISDLASKRARNIVKNSIAYVVHKVHNVVFDRVKHVYIVTVSTDGSLKDLRGAMKTNYGGKASDTWMEGNIMIKDMIELHLSFVGCAIEKNNRSNQHQ